MQRLLAKLGAPPGHERQKALLSAIPWPQPALKRVVPSVLEHRLHGSWLGPRLPQALHDDYARQDRSIEPHSRATTSSGPPTIIFHFWPWPSPESSTKQAKPSRLTARSHHDPALPLSMSNGPSIHHDFKDTALPLDCRSGSCHSPTQQNVFTGFSHVQ